MQFCDASRITTAALDRYLDDAANRTAPVIRQVPMRDMVQSLELERWIAKGGLGREAALTDFMRVYLGASTRLQHPGYMAHQVAVPHPLGALASLIDGLTNNAMAIYEMGPAAASVEFAVLNWMLGKVGWNLAPYPDAASETEIHGGGVLTHGGSLANLTALAAARARLCPKAWRYGAPGNLAVIASPGCHYSIARAAGVMGIGQNAVLHAPADDMGRMDVRGLDTLIAALRRQGKKILAVVATACSTAVGAFDPLRAIAEICRARDVWLHVDGAHGASALVSGRHRGLLDGVELADSLTWDAHKMLRAPTLCAALLVRDSRYMDGAFSEDASYLFHEKDQPGFDFIHRTVECTKAALGLKAFFALASEGESGLAAYIDRQAQLAKDAARYLSQVPDMEVAMEPIFNIVCFRVAGDDARQLEVRRRLLEAGRHYISSTEFRNRRWLRLALMNPATELDDIKALAEEIRCHLRAMDGEG